jgi:outer membrane protein assembly factor BamB
MYQMDALHTGRSPHTGPRRLALLRTFATTAPENRPADAPAITTPDIQSSTAVGPDGTIYATTFSGWTYALRDSASARDRLDLAWRFRPTEGGSPAHGTAAVSRDGSTVYVGYGVGTAPNQKAVLYALRAPASGQDAQIVWQTELGPGGAANSPTITDDGTIYYVDVLGLLAAVDSNGGRLKWTAQIGTTGEAPFGQTVKVAPAVAPDGTVYVTAVTGSLYAVSPPAGSGNQGSVKWSFDFGQHLGPTPLVSTPVTNGGNRGQDAIGSAASATLGPDGTIYVGANNSNFHAIDPNGQQKWMYEAERELAGIWTTAALSPDASVLFFGANKGGVYALNSRDGSVKWKFPVYGSIYSSLILDARGTLYTGTTVGPVYALDSASGEPVADYSPGAAVWTAPAIRTDSTLVVGDRTGRILVLGDG